MTYVYRFTWGEYEDSGEGWYSHAEKMTTKEIIERLATVWALGRAEYVAMYEDYEDRENDYRWRMREVENSGNRWVYADNPWPSAPCLSDYLLERAGFVRIAPEATVDIDRIASDWKHDPEYADKSVALMAEQSK